MNEDLEYNRMSRKNYQALLSELHNLRAEAQSLRQELAEYAKTVSELRKECIEKTEALAEIIRQSEVAGNISTKRVHKILEKYADRGKE